MSRNSDRRSGTDRRANVALGRARGWIALVGMVVAGGGGAQLGSQHAESAMSQDSAKMLIHARDREIDGMRDDVKSVQTDVHQLRDDISRRLDGIERRLP